MVYDRHSREGNRADRDFDYANDRGPGRDPIYSSARDYAAAGSFGRDRDDRGGYGRSDEGRGRYGAAGQGYGDRGHDRQVHGWRDHGHDRYRRYEPSGGYGGGHYGSGRPYRDADAPDGRFLDEGGRDRHDDHRRQEQRGYGRQPQGYQYEDRGFIERAGDEVRSWFGDDEAERRREADQRYDERAERAERGGSRHHDEDYHHWRSAQIASLDRDYDEYRRENRSRFNSEFSTWRTGRQGQREQLNKVTEHQEVVGSDGAHVGTVDKVKGDRILLTKNDEDAGGQHHSFPSGWIASVDDKVTLNRSADEAKQAWRDEDRHAAASTYGDNAKAGRADAARTDADTAARGPSRSFSGTY